MEIRVDGYRSSREDWIQAHRISADDLPPIDEEESEVAAKLGISSEEYRRSKYAADLTRTALEQRADAVGGIATAWLRENRIPSQVVSVWLKTLEGKFRVEVTSHQGTKLIFIREELIDDLLESGSLTARDDFNRLLEANFAPLIEKRAS